jgi:hypothetical protein
MLKTYNDKTPPPRSTHRLTVTNEETGEIELEMTNLEGGLLIAHDKDDGLMGTHQTAFGATSAIVLCALKIRPVIRQMMKQDATLREAIERGDALAKEAGLETTL